MGDIFEGLNAVKRQQTIYKVLNEHISSGAIHAVTMRLSAPSDA
jgi:acid stress-induced BolA-like protein IbaG/YrbA